MAIGYTRVDNLVYEIKGLLIINNSRLASCEAASEGAKSKSGYEF